MSPELAIDSDISRIDWAKVHGWLTTSYWCPGVTRERVECAAENSALVLGAYVGPEQVGFLRVVSDRARIAYLCDVWVDQAHRGRGIGRAMVAHAMAHQDFDGLMWLLGTKDAHGVYAALGFTPLVEPQRWMQFKRQS